MKPVRLESARSPGGPPGRGRPRVGSGRVSTGGTRVDPTVDPLLLVPFVAQTRKPYETPTLADLERANVADGELIHECRWRAKEARQRIANRRAEIDRLRGAA